jgi:hypothetical protein
MALREVGGKKHYPKFKDCEEGEVLVDGVFRREIMGKYGEQYEFENGDGEIIVLNAAGQLRYKMDFVKEDQAVKIIYDGQIILESGAMKGRPAHQFKVFVGDLDGDGVTHGATDDDDDGFDSFEEL